MPTSRNCGSSPASSAIWMSASTKRCGGMASTTTATDSAGTPRCPVSVVSSCGPAGARCCPDCTICTSCAKLSMNFPKFSSMRRPYQRPRSAEPLQSVALKRPAEDAGTLRERAGVGPGVVEADERAGGFGGKPFRAGGDQQSGPLAVHTQLLNVGPVRKPRPEVQPAFRHQREVGLRDVFAKARHQQVAARLELVPDAAQVRLPGRLGDDVEGCSLEQAADVHRLGPAVREDALPG